MTAASDNVDRIMRDLEALLDEWEPRYAYLVEDAENVDWVHEGF